ncbi:LysM peptidoglycan-binding domain-containing protein [Metallumcola ferriviriculae]|uniref:LysM peptidoglycan-binding domain-containing protein n=1 Tax=Metallumcola ferriviriculae TaxID=3039180 RepID=A0AAU0UMT4_9FIRM|nr:LysM peptidoglycan-binding domain-containing protein [Desulfitibacteraceae bacterium MK1]
MQRHRVKMIVIMFTILFSVLSMGTAWAWTYYVQQGDSLYFIGQRFGTSSQELKGTNGLKSTMIYPGQKLEIPEKAQTASSNTYTVKAGDSLSSIAMKFGVKYSQIRSANNLTSDLILVGQQLLIPTGTNTSASRTNLSRSSYDRDQVMLLAKLIYGEARGESYQGQLAIAAVTLNRVDSPLFPNTLRGVIFEPWAFTAVHDGQFYMEPNSTAIKAATDALNGSDPTNGALYYWNPATATNTWVWTRQITGKIGQHLFAI